MNIRSPLGPTSELHQRGFPATSVHHRLGKTLYFVNHMYAASLQATFYPKVSDICGNATLVNILNNERQIDKKSNLTQGR